MKKYKLVVFDFDMTLADTAGVIVDLLNQTAEYFGYSRKNYCDVIKWVGNTHEIMLSKVTGVSDKEKIAVMREYYRNLSRKVVPERTSFFPGVKEAILMFRKEGIKIGILSLKLKELILKPLNKFGLEDEFDYVLGCEEVAKQKPAPDGLYQIARMAGVSMEEIFYIGDSLVDEETAKNAGVDFGAMLLGATKKEDFDQDFTKIFFNSYEELYLCTSVQKEHKSR